MPMKDPAYLPSHDGKFVQSFKEDNAIWEETDGSFILGRICELHQKPDEAKWWYHQSMSSPGSDFTFRILAAQRMSAMGDDPFKQ